MLIITEQRKVGAMFGHPVYQVTRTAMIELSNSKMRPAHFSTKDENRYAYAIFGMLYIAVVDFKVIHKF
jgi:hypothetical protein